MTSKTLIPAAVVGGLTAAAVTAALTLTGALGDRHTTTTTRTVVQQAPLTRTQDVAAGRDQGLTAREIYERHSDGVVFVRADVVTDSQQTSPFGLPSPRQQGRSTGTGFVADRDGHILTNAHVIDGAVKVTVQLRGDQTVEAAVVGKDTSTDVALLKVDPDGLNLHPLELGTASDLQVGDPVVAIGNPFGLDRTLTTGVVSALQREITAPDGFKIRDVVQTDAAINPGNSGGPLIDAHGQVVGINSQIATGTGGNVGIGFAVPAETAKRVMDDLKDHGSVKRAWLGVTAATIDGKLDGLNLPARSGALVQTVQDGSPADRAGLRAGGITAQLPDGQPVTLGGDVVTSVDGKPVRTADDLVQFVSQRKPGDTIAITVLRDGRNVELEAQLADRSTRDQRD